MDCLVSIPNRDSRHLDMARGRESASSAAEVSIPDRDLMSSIVRSLFYPLHLIIYEYTHRIITVFQC